MFAAGNYVIFGRLLHYGSLLYPGKRLTWLPTRNVVAVFVTSDVISFLVQVGGAILLLGQNDSPQRQQNGQSILMAGLAINLASFCFFFTLIIWFEVATRKIIRHLPNKKRSYAPIVYASMVSQLFLIGRSIYRVIEFQQGYFSAIATTELYFYLFDCMFMLFATSIYIPFFPAAFGLLGKKRLALKLEEQSIEMGEARPETRRDHVGTMRGDDDCLIAEQK
jgi:RTA1 like protein